MFDRRVMLRCLPLVFVMASASLQASPRTAEHERELLPTRSDERSDVAFEYRLVPPSTLTIVNGELTAQWDGSRFDVADVVVAADFEALQPVVPGRATPFSIDMQKRRYDVMGWMTDRTTGERFRFASPLWTPSGLASREPSLADWPQQCTLTEDVQCPDGSTVSVSCSGENGTCFSCSLGKSACCRASVREESDFGNGRRQELLVINQESLSCPPTPEPRPGQPRVHGFRR